MLAFKTGQILIEAVLGIFCSVLFLLSLFFFALKQDQHTQCSEAFFDEAQTALFDKKKRLFLKKSLLSETPTHWVFENKKACGVKKIRFQKMQKE